MNWVDAVLIILVVFTTVGGFTIGFTRGAIDLLHLVVSVFVAAIGYPYAAMVFTLLGITKGLALFLGFISLVVIVQIVLAIIAKPFFRRIKNAVKGSSFEPVDRIFGPLPSLASFFIITSFLLAFILSFPVAEPVQTAIRSSRFGMSVAQPAMTILAGQADKVNRELQSNPI